MKTEEELDNKLQELKAELRKLEDKGWIWTTKKEALSIEFLKNNIAFINWALDKPILTK